MNKKIGESDTENTQREGNFQSYDKRGAEQDRDLKFVSNFGNSHNRDRSNRDRSRPESDKIRDSSIPRVVRFNDDKRNEHHFDARDP